MENESDSSLKGKILEYNKSKKYQNENEMSLDIHSYSSIRNKISIETNNSTSKKISLKKHINNYGLSFCQSNNMTKNQSRKIVSMN